MSKDINNLAVLNTIEEISIPKTCSDLWNDLYGSCSAISKMLVFYPDTTSKFRLMGGLYRGKRVYISPELHLAEIMSSNDLMKCLRGDMSLFLNIARGLASQVPAEKPLNKPKQHKELSYSLNDSKNTFINILDGISSVDKQGIKSRETLMELFRLVTAEGWQPCLFSNVFLIEQFGSRTSNSPNRIFIVCFPLSLCRDIFRAVAESSKSEQEANRKKISGMLAHDIVIERKGSKFATKYITSISSEEYFMPKDWVSHVLKQKLIDPRLLIKEINGNTVRNQSGFIYKIEKDCSFTDEMMNGIRKEIDEIKEVECLRSVEEHLNELPEDAFQSPAKGTIGSLEL